MQEQLFACIPDEHTLAGETSLTFSQLNGFNCLLRDHIGFWTDMVKAEMPASCFLVQTDDFEFDELVRTSTLLSFTTNIANPLNNVPERRSLIPIADSTVKVSYYSPDRILFSNLLYPFQNIRIRSELLILIETDIKSNLNAGIGASVREDIHLLRHHICRQFSSAGHFTFQTSIYLTERPGQ